MACLVDHTHPAPAEHADDLIAGQLRPVFPGGRVRCFLCFVRSLDTVVFGQCPESSVEWAWICLRITSTRGSAFRS